MNREYAEERLKAYGSPVIKTENVTIAFARQKWSDVEEIEAMTTEEIIDELEAQQKQEVE